MTISQTERHLLPTLHVEPGFHPIERVRLDDDEYARAITNFVIVCTDIVLVNRASRTIYLAKRCSKPMAGWWVIGGRTRAGEDFIESARRSLKRETTLDLSTHRFQFLMIARYWWKDRKQEPTDVGCDDLVFVFAVEPDEAELATAASHLDTKEYDRPSGLRAFGREELVREEIHQAVLSIYDGIFSEPS